jgi:hypothetical protein
VADQRPIFIVELYINGRLYAFSTRDLEVVGALTGTSGFGKKGA